MQSLPLYTIFAAWRDALANSQAIKDYCVTHYGKEPKIFAGLNLRNAPKPPDAPYIILRPGSKSEGEQNPQQYTLAVGWAVQNEQETMTGNIIELAGVKEIDELGELILACLAAVSPGNPITSTNYDVDSVEFFPLHVGVVDVTVEIETAMGGSVVYP